VTDILIIGAGPVGATFALLAASRGLDVALIDARADPKTNPPRETRSLALSHGSRVLLERAGAWQPSLQPSEIHTVHTSQQGGFGRVKLSRDDASVPALGYVVGYAALQDALDESLETARLATTFSARVSKIVDVATHVEVTFLCEDEMETTQTINAKMVVMADGGANLDKLPEIKVDEKDYGQSAMLATITAERVHKNTAYERFTPDGPLALLPYKSEHDYAMVWVDTHDKIKSLMAESDDAARAAFQAAFGTRAGKFTALQNRRAYPLRLRQTDCRVTGRIAIIGNAAQAMHPVAGQGFNLGLRDADHLARLLSEHNIENALQQYDAARETDVSRGVGFTDLLASAFLSDVAMLRVPRGAALAAVDMLPVARRLLARRMLFGARS
jgi:2-octaprenyl-6-methoxyphenol hydroxylase